MSAETNHCGDEIGCISGDQSRGMPPDPLEVLGLGQICCTNAKLVATALFIFSKVPPKMYSTSTWKHYWQLEAY